ncbi:MAG: chloride channel protein, partial [Deferribacterota bacterium]|nr:chloride channel protein [Deferribacterota bacterium]
MNTIHNILKNLNLPVIGRWFILGIIVGIVSGIGAIIFFILLQSSSIFFLNHIAGLPLEETGGESFLFPLKNIEFKRWMLLIIPTLGGLISGVLIYTFCPEAEGHGTDAAIKAIHLKNG